MDFTLPLGGSKARNEPSGRADGGSIGVPTTLPGNSPTLVSDPPSASVALMLPPGSCGTRITDASICLLKELDTLEELWIYDTQITREGVALLGQALPKCWIRDQL